MADSTWHPTKAASFQDLPLEIQLQVLRSLLIPFVCKRPLNTLTKHEGVYMQAFPIAPMLVSRHFNRLATQVFYAENDLIVHLRAGSERITHRDLAAAHSAIRASVRSVHLRFLFTAKYTRTRQDYYTRLRANVADFCQATRVLKSLRCIDISVFYVEEVEGRKEVLDTLAILKALPKELMCRLEHVSPKTVRHESFEKTLGELLGVDVKQGYDRRLIT